MLLIVHHKNQLFLYFQVLHKNHHQCVKYQQMLHYLHRYVQHQNDKNLEKLDQVLKYQIKKH